MLLRVTSNKESFREVTFKPGFNVILADQSAISEVKDTRNGVGKTTLIEIIHFCLGAQRSKLKTLSKPELNEWVFECELLIEGKKVKVYRATSRASEIFVEDEGVEWRIPPQSERNGRKKFNIRSWTNNLLWHMFGKEPGESYDVSFRSLISYFIRREDGFYSPFRHHRNQKQWDVVIHNLFLLGLPHDLTKKIQLLKEKEKAITQLEKAVKKGFLKDFILSTGALEAKKVHLEQDIKRLEKELASFKVHPEYHEIENEVNELTVKINELSNKNVVDKNLLSFYESAIQEEKNEEPDVLEIVSLYNTAGIEVPEMVKKRLDDVKTFFFELTRNRNKFLKNEVKVIENRIKKREEEIKKLDEERAKKMNILKTHGALEQFYKLQNRLTKLRTELENINKQIDNTKQIIQGKQEIKIELDTLAMKAQQLWSEYEALRSKVISIFNENSKFLYNVPGSLIIDFVQTDRKIGYDFKIEIPREGSAGIEKMKIFCYDLMLAQLWSEKKPSPGFLIHDSTLFAEVDNRQVALSLILANKKSQEFGFQYICLLNSDMVPKEILAEKGLNIEEYVRLRLMDEPPEKSLLGFRF